MRGTMKTRTRVTILLACAVTAGGAVVAVQAGAAPTSYTSLDQAASKPIGIGSRGVVKELRSERPKISPKQVFKDAGVARGGCNVAYGVGGQCLPSVPPSQAEHVAAGHMKPQWECTQVRVLFKDGIALAKAKADPQRLDKNKDGTACGKGD